MSRTFNRRMTHQVPVDTADGAGGFVRTWVSRGALWCEIRMRSGSLKATEFGDTARLKVRILTHAVPSDHDARPWPGHRMLDGPRTFVIDAVHESDSAGRYLTILATEMPEAGGAP
ncbi:tail protein [Jannaschia pagri]|uniref:Tail protein n=1 Tax=Jannaschia pagri TaxID=2829797 RepID=A0ABQ4NNG3_9RHOB|nr:MULTISPECIES: head-tail adaptor protein [unclassified Jannaschia]GIT91818.1 tail protein [Jannaschia sp. AI_61]GIT95652.1 tail protein [Jannaschia sp. AI_62]